MDSQCNSNSPLDIEDIEDLFDQAPPESLSKTSVNSKLVVPKVKKRTKKGIRIEEIETKTKESHEKDDEEEQCFLPGQAKIYVKTWGCSHNVSDGEYMSGILAAQGYTVQDEKSSADLWILNSCTVFPYSFLLATIFISPIRTNFILVQFKFRSHRQLL